MGCRLSVHSIGSKQVDVDKMHRFFRKQKKPESQESDNTPKLEISLRSAVLIQRWYRRYLARIEVRQRYTWKIFQSIEYAGELDQMKLYNFFNALLNHIDPEKESNDSTRRCSVTYHAVANSADDSTDPLTNTDPRKIRVDSAYKGPHLSETLTRLDLLSLIEGYKARKTLHIRYVYVIIHEAIQILSKMPTISRSSTAVTGRVTVCGDLHGKLDDLLIIFHKNGLPSKDNPYVFNGDFVDRGKHSIEVLLVLLMCMILNPTVVHLNRGNHEDPMMNARYGFTKEVMIKYKNHASALLALLGQLFAWLPIGTLIDNRALVVHGGISNETDIQWLQNVERQHFVSVLKAPNVQSSEYDHDTLKVTYLWKQILDVLWSDPKNVPGCSVNAFRGGGCYFGPDITKNVLRKNGISMLIRSHECKAEGYEYTHDGLCLTIFSASNYYGPGSNRGAYVILQGKELKPHFVQFSAQTKIKYINMNERVGALEKSALQELRTKILLHKTVLASEFRKIDKENKGLIDVNDWIQVMDRHCCPHIPWRLLREKMVRIDSATGAIPYEETFHISSTHTLENSQTVVETLYSNRDRLETIFRTLDKDNSGFLSLDEVADACSLLKDFLSEPIPYDEMVNLARSMDINKDGYIDFNEFLEAFRLVDIEHGQDHGQDVESFE